MWCKQCFDILNRLGVDNECDRQTDRETCKAPLAIARFNDHLTTRANVNWWYSLHRPRSFSNGRCYQMNLLGAVNVGRKTSRHRELDHVSDDLDRCFEVAHPRDWVISGWTCRLNHTRSSATAEIARVGVQYAAQGCSRSLILVPIESRIRLPIVNNNNLHPISHRLPDIAHYWSNHCFWRRVSVVDAFILGTLWEYRHKSYIAEN